MDGSKPHRRNQSVPQAIPLQDLSSREDEVGTAEQYKNGHQRTLSDRGRELFQSSRNTLLRLSQDDISYAPIRHDAFAAGPRQQEVGGVGLGLAIDTGFIDRYKDESSQFSKSAPGISISNDHAYLGYQRQPRRIDGISLIDDEDERETGLPDEVGDGTGAFALENDLDTTPLTSSIRTHQSSFSQNSPSGQRHERHTPKTSGPYLLTPGRQNSQTSDDPTVSNIPSPYLSTGDLSGRKSSGKVSVPASPISPIEAPLRKAGNVMQQISQRIVNISNEPAVVEKSIRRSPSAPTMEFKPSPTSIPPSPKMPDGINGSSTLRPSMSEKAPPLVLETKFTDVPLPNITLNSGRHPNPLRGKSLGIFGPDNPIRLSLCEFLTHPLLEPAILFLIISQTVLLVIDAAKDVYIHPRSQKWGKNWVDYALFVLFIFYSLEVIVRVIVSGLFVNPIEYSTIHREIGVRKAVATKVTEMFAIHRKVSVSQATSAITPHPLPLIRTLTMYTGADLIPGTARQAQRERLAHRAFLRHSFNRLDFIAVIAYWVSFAFAVGGTESSKHLYVFRMLSCLRILRLLGITGGTSVILRSLKRAMPILLNVAFLISFFWLLFAIIGVQSFKSSLRRTCVWSDPDASGPNPWPSYAQNTPGQFQFCGGWLDANGTTHPYLVMNGLKNDGKPKGYICPINSKCVEAENPYNGTVSFDNLPQSLEMVFVIMTSNTFSDIMYYLTDSDYLVAALFYAFGIVILTLWLVNLLIAVITSSFQIIREESKASAFAAEQTDDISAIQGNEPQKEVFVRPRENRIKKAFERTKYFWLTVIAVNVVFSALRSASMGRSRANLLLYAEIGVTFMLDIEIVLRFLVDVRGFFKSKRNMVDLGLAVMTSLILLPPVRDAGRAYAWLTIFQIMRVYRIVLAVRMTRELIMVVLGNFSGLLNLILFVFLLTFLAAIFATQLFRGELAPVDVNGNALQVTFFNMWNAFLGMYQILSSENWTNVLYSVTASQVAHDNGWIGATFCILWYILANFVVLNMFIAVIQENFDVSEDEKRLQQVKAFLRQKKGAGSSTGTLSLSSVFKFGQARRQDPLAYGTAATEMLLKDAVVKNFLQEPDVPMSAITPSTKTGAANNKIFTQAPNMGWWKRIVSKVFHNEPNPFHSREEFTSAHQEMDPRAMAREAVQAADRRKVAQREYLRKHPNYNTTLFIFRPDNPIRKFCQKIVGPGQGRERIQGSMPSAPIWYAFSAFIYMAIVAMVILACVTTPLYQKGFFAEHGFSRGNWFIYTDIGFAALFTVEACIKVVADGVFWTPNAYFRGSWGLIDGIVLVTLWANVMTLLYAPGNGSRAVGAFKALRALRLLNVSDSARDTFHSVIVLGGWKVLSAALVSLSLLIPFAIYGLNLFSGRMQLCNDNSGQIYHLTDCVNEYLSSPYQWNVLAPREVDNSYFGFDDFGSSLFILFQIVSQEGWIDVMWAAQSMTGVFTQPQPFANQAYAIFFVIFNLLGAVFVLTLFVSVFMRNYTEQTGVAFLTTDQRSWLELRKLLRQLSPAKRPSAKKVRQDWQEWCYRRATQKTGYWHRTMTGVLILQLILLCLEWYPVIPAWLIFRNIVFALLCLIYMFNIVIRIIGLSWSRFRRSLWDLYSIVSISGAFAMSFIVATGRIEQRVFVQIQKMFISSTVLLLIPRNNQLDQLFKTAAASLNSIANLLATWFVMFLVFAIALTQTFGLTRFGANEKSNVNVRTVPKALILLFRISVGEGWNQLMYDYATIRPPYCTVGDKYFDGDCGSENWARAIFVSWNILSMYIFVNLFVSLIYESFSYVYQRSSGLSVISREEIRRFKQAWALHDPDGTGWISKQDFPRLLGDLTGVFEMRIYDGDFSVKSIVSDCMTNPNRLTVNERGMSAKSEVDLVKLNRRLADLPVHEIRQRRQRMNTFYEEVLVSADPDRGVSFTTLLMILSHYKVINDNRSLRLEEFLRRTYRLQRVEEQVNRNVVSGFFDMLYWSRKFQRNRAVASSRSSNRGSDVSALHTPRRRPRSATPRGASVATTRADVPEIFVQDEHDSPHAIRPSSPLFENGPSPSTPMITISPDGAFDASPHHSDYSTPSKSSPRILAPHMDTSPSPSPALSRQSLDTVNPAANNVAGSSPSIRFAAGLLTPTGSPPTAFPSYSGGLQASTGTGSRNRAGSNASTGTGNRSRAGSTASSMSNRSLQAALGIPTSRSRSNSAASQSEHYSQALAPLVDVGEEENGSLDTDVNSMPTRSVRGLFDFVTRPRAGTTTAVPSAPRLVERLHLDDEDEFVNAHVAEPRRLHSIDTSMLTGTGSHNPTSLSWSNNIMLGEPTTTRPRAATTTSTAGPGNPSLLGNSVYDPTIANNRSSTRSPRTNATQHRDVLDVLENSAWGESLRRSFTPHGATHGNHDRAWTTEDATTGGRGSSGSGTGNGRARARRRSNSVGHDRRSGDVELGRLTSDVDRSEGGSYTRL